MKKQKMNIKVRGMTFTGIVISRKMQKTAKIRWDRIHPLKKYERYEKRFSTVTAHVPDNIEVREGDKVVIKECRPLSKTKHFVIIKNESNEIKHK